MYAYKSCNNINFQILISVFSSKKHVLKDNHSLLKTGISDRKYCWFNSVRFLNQI